jgi:hypothetical protein
MVYSRVPHSKRAFPPVHPQYNSDELRSTGNAEARPQFSPFPFALSLFRHFAIKKLEIGNPVG